jgi:phosphopantetheine--protein transferase-like protein
MMIGVGVDIVHIERIVALWNRHRARLCESVFTRGELAAGGLGASASGTAPEAGLTTRQAQFLAERFAGKEAAIKVLGLGHSTPFELNDIEIDGSPTLRVRLTAALTEIAARQGIDRMTGSCSSTKHTTVALLIGETTYG